MDHALPAEAKSEGGDYLHRLFSTAKQMNIKI